MQEIINEEVLVIEAHDQDNVSSDLLGRTMPLSLSALTQTEEFEKHTLDLFDNNYKHIGSVNINTQYVFQDVEPLPPLLTEQCSLEIELHKVEFFKDHDMFGKQDPFITFLQGDKLHRSKTVEDAGKLAVINQKFSLKQIYKVLEPDEDVTFQAFDEDIGGKADFLGQTRPLPFRKMCQNYSKN